MPAKSRRRSFRSVVSGILGLIVLCFFAVFFFIISSNMMEMLRSTEDTNMDEKLARVENEINSSARHLETITKNLAFWQETVGYVNGINPDYFYRNWGEANLLQRQDISFISIKNLKGDNVYTEFRDLINDKPAEIPSGFSSYINTIATKVLRSAKIPKTDISQSGRSGVLFYDGNLYSFCAMPIMSMDSAAPPAGTVTTGILLDEEMLRYRTNLTQVGFSFSYDRESWLPGGVSYSDSNSNLAFSAINLSDYAGNPFQLKISVEREMFAKGQRLMQTTSIMLFAASAVFMLLLYLAISRFLLRPVEYLSKDIRDISRSEMLDITKYSSNAEMNTLASSINEMLGVLNQSSISINVFTSILNGMDAFLYVSDPETDEILFINNKMKKHFGLDDNAIGQTCWKLLQDGFDQRCSFCPIHSLQSGNEPNIIWQEHNTVTGRHYQNADCLIEWSSGKMVHLQHSIDITETIDAQAALEKQLLQQELMASISQSFISTDDIQVLLSKALDKAGEFMQMSKIVFGRFDKATGMIHFEYVWYNPNEDVPFEKNVSYPFTEFALYKKLVIEKQPYVYCRDVRSEPEFEFMRKVGVMAFLTIPIVVAGEFWGILTIDKCNGSYEWTQSDIHLVEHIGSIISVVIERNSIEEELFRMSSIVNTSPQYISYTDMEGKFVYLNHGAEIITGYSAQELKEGGMALIFDEESLAIISGELTPRVIVEGKLSFDLPIIRKDKERRILSFSIFTVDHKNKGIGVIAVDITQIKQLQEQMLAAKEQAEQSSRAKSDFLSRMSHEMRTPMNAIIGMSNIAKSSNELERIKYCLDKVGEASNHLLGVINDILDMSKIEANKFELSYHEFELERMLQRVVSIINFRVDERNQKLIVNIDKSVPYSIVSDEQRLAQVITNLLSNAVKFTPDNGAITLSVTLLSEEDGECTLQVNVTDTGIGISDEQKRRLFRSFEQADGSVSRKFGGTGLGLAISKNIIELMNGSIWVESEEGKGSSFLFTIKTRRGQSRPAGQENISWSSLRTLVVDAEGDAGEYFRSLSETVGFESVAAKNASEALSILKTCRDNGFTAIFIDFRLPDGNGLKLASQIKATSGAKAVVLIISAAEWNEIEPQATAEGIDQFIPKPLFASTIIDLLTSCVGNKRDVDPGSKDTETGRYLGHRILLAEDIEINREIVIALLEDTGLEIDCAENGLIALNMFERSPAAYDMIFMDIHMPEMDGYEATRCIRALELPEAKSVPIVAMTANVFREDIENCRAAGMIDHVGKPVSIEDILDKLDRYLLKKI